MAPTQAQRFEAAALFGLNASQINGDDEAGYNKIGLAGGLRLTYPLKPNVRLGMELLYSERGSRSEFSLGNPDDLKKISLTYLEIPVFVVVQDWYIEDKGFYKVRAEGGFSYARLFQSSSQNSFFDDAIDNFNKSDFSFLLGVAYQFNPKWAFGIRYTRSINDLYSDASLQLRGLLGYFLTFRGEFYF